jgi:hypothetical protein
MQNPAHWLTGCDELDSVTPFECQPVPLKHSLGDNKLVSFSVFYEDIRRVWPSPEDGGEHMQRVLVMHGRYLLRVRMLTIFHGF